MDNNPNPSLMKWSALRGLPVRVPSEGITIGTVEDFYFQPDTNAVYALCVRVRLTGDRSLPVTGIRSVGPDGVMIPNAQMLLERLPPLPTGQQIANAKLTSEGGQDLGVVKEIVMGVNPPVTMRIAGFEMFKRGGRQSLSFSADAIGSYHDANVVVRDLEAKRLK
jgi:uncharacterized protein YrrD